MTEPKPPTLNSTSDPLGYDAYATALWNRIEQAINNDMHKNKELGDDPLVIGLFGEWGVGKSYLLERVLLQLDPHKQTRIEHRKGDSGFALTVPVVFQPWKYEHEPHLHVPLLLHMISALQSVERESRSWGTKFVDVGQKASEAVIKFLPALVKGLKQLAKATEEALPLGSSAALAAAEPIAKGLAADSAALARSKANLAKTLAYTDNGRYFYDIHKYLKAITRPGKSSDGFLPDLPSDVNFHVNFVVFIDDLDRCLPESAVQVLELIKTIFNLESFAFVLALDEEVIERGIGHRYREYSLADKKPQMPITGFEYLEKIVHLPFRLPPLTRYQAEKFVQLHEANVEEKSELHWFSRSQQWPADRGAMQTDRSAAIGQGKKKPTTDDKTLGSNVESLNFRTTPTLIDSPYLRLLTESFEAYVPRKLIRVVELWHQVCRVAAARGVTSATNAESTWNRWHGSGNTSLDTRVLFTLVLLQLFIPELYRFMRRRKGAFPSLLRAFDKRNGIHLKSGDVSEAELWRWVCSDLDCKSTINNAMEAAGAIAIYQATEKSNGNTSFIAQQIRLRLVERLIEHAAVERHVFNPLRVIFELSDMLERTGNLEHLQMPNAMEPYFSVLAQDVTVEERAALQAITNKQTDGSLQRFERFTVTDLDGLWRAITNPDTTARSTIVESYRLRDGQVLSEQNITELEALFSDCAANATLSQNNETDNSTTNFAFLISALYAIAPWVSWQDGGNRLAWALATPANGTSNNNTEHGKNMPQSAQAIITALASKAREHGKIRASIGNLIERFAGGDPRFNSENYFLPVENLINNPTLEPIAGFVWFPRTISATQFVMGHSKQSANQPDKAGVAISKPFCIARYATTVAQFRAFIEDGGYGVQTKTGSFQVDLDLWSRQGQDWRFGRLDESGYSTRVKEHLDRRPMATRNQPWGWAEQLAHPSHPVTGICWFEARAYARWLNKKLQPALLKLKLQSECRLPLENEWERAARSQSNGEIHRFKHTWPDDTRDSIACLANTSEAEIGTTCSVGLFPSANQELFDMLGNSWEWMDNLYANPRQPVFEVIEKTRELTIGNDWGQGDCPALRGGSWVDDADLAAVSFRGRIRPDSWDNGIGLRVVLSLSILNSET